MGLDDDGYYTLRHILGYNCKYNIVMSDRGRGKSYGTKKFLMAQPGKAMCLYRQSFDMESARGGWLDDLRKQGWDMSRFSWEGSEKSGWTLKLDDEPKIWFRYLTQVNHIKQESFPADMDWIWWDEFIPLAYKKLAGVSSEGDALRAIVKTVEHDTVRSRADQGLKPLRVLLYANPFTWNNPVLSYFRVAPRGYGIWRAGPGVAVEMLAPADVQEDPAEAFLGDEVHQNQGWVNSGAFVAPVPAGARLKATFRILNGWYERYTVEGRDWIAAGSGHRGDVPHFGSLEGLLPGEQAIPKKFQNFLQNEVYNDRIWYDAVNTKYDYLRNISDLR